MDFKHIFKSKKCNENRGKLDLILDFAKDVIDKTTTYECHPVFNVIKILASKLNYNNVEFIISSPEHARDYSPMHWFHQMFVGDNSYYIDDSGNNINSLLKRLSFSSMIIDLSKDAIIATPDTRKSLSSAISNIGRNQKNEEWTQDSNHCIEVWLPTGIVWVHGGNHSIISGILQGEGKIDTGAWNVLHYIYDVSKIYEHISFDGTYYRDRKREHQIICKAPMFELGAIYEVGRLIQDKNIPFKGILPRDLANKPQWKS